ncbi:MAG: sulfotransferase domain-containing protein [Gammaproteobacteria bacterium]|nr:sulfotransferase domain-containing protein [Gammaproteobacteria bacterium]
MVDRLGASAAELDPDSHLPSRVQLACRPGERVRLVGWAATHSGAVQNGRLQVDLGSTRQEAYYGLDRPDVADSFGDPGYRYSGFECELALGDLGSGQLPLAIVLCDPSGRELVRGDPLTLDLSLDPPLRAEQLRLLIASPVKTGNVWLKNLLSHMYGLRMATPPQYEFDELDSFADYLRVGMFRPGSVTHQHFLPSARFFELIEPWRCQVITTIRHPYDVFVSLYFHVQNKDHLFFEEDDPHNPLLGEDLDTPAALDFLRDQFTGVVRHMELWHDSGRSIMLRYEDLRRQPLETLRGLAEGILPLPEETIRAAIDACSMEKMKKRDRTGHVRKGMVGDWRNHLTDAHLEILRAPPFCDQIEKLGYVVY